MQAASRYSHLSSTRDTYLRRAENHAKVTIPALFPPAGFNGSQDLYTPYQSTGSRCVNTLAAKLLMAMFPANTLFYKLALDETIVKELAGRKNVRGELDRVLSITERKALLKLETSLFRPTMAEAFKQLVVAGNVCIHMPTPQEARMFKLNQYVVKRSPRGELVEAVIEEELSKATLSDEVRKIVDKHEVQSSGLPSSEQKGRPLPSQMKSAHDTVKVYTHLIRVQKKINVYQEVNGEVIPDTTGSYPVDKCPYLFLRLNKMDGEDYGRAYVEDYYGDLFTLENLEQAMTNGSIAMSKIIFLTDPTGTTRAEDLAEAESGDFVEGRREDIATLQVEKYQDLSFVAKRISDIESRLAYAFLLNTAIQRPGERVTAEEIRYMARELEDVLGGVYSVLSQELQLPIANLLMAALEKSGDLPKTPDKALNPRIVTGIDALGKGQDLNKLDQLIGGGAELFGPQVVAQRVDPGEYFARRAAALGIDPDGLILTDEDLAQNQANQALQNATPEMIKAAGGLAGKAMETMNGQ